MARRHRRADPVGFQLSPALTAIAGIGLIVAGLAVDRPTVAIVGIVLLAVAAVRYLTGWRA